MLKIIPKTIKYYDLFPLLKSLEKERPGIKDRVWKFLCEEKNDIQFMPIKGRILGINLFFYGAGDEYPLEYLKKYPEKLENCKQIFPEAFVDGSPEKELRLDFNLIWYIYQDEIDNCECFYIMPNF